MDARNFIFCAQEVLDDYYKRVTQEFSELENKRVAQMGSFDYETISKIVEDFARTIFNLEHKHLLKPMAMQIIKQDQKLQDFFRQLTQKEEKELFMSCF